MTEPTTRERILAAAREVFAERGLPAATMQEIRQRAGVSNGSLFHFFPTKEAVSAAVYLDAITSYQAGLIELLEAPAAPEATVRGIVRYHLDWTVRHRATARFLLELGHAPPGTALAEQVAAANARLRAAVDAWLRRAVAAEAVKPLAVDVVVACLIGPAQVICRAWLARGEG